MSTRSKVGNVLISREGPLVVATLNKPEQRNVISTREDSREIEKFCREMTEDHTVRVIVLTGAGAAFCAGMSSTWRPGRECLQAIRMNSGITIGLAFKRFPFPVRTRSSHGCSGQWVGDGRLT